MTGAESHAENLPGVDPDEFTLSFRGRPESLVSARLFAASVARHLGSGEEQVEDLKLAVSEACTNAIQARATEKITVAIVPNGDAVAVRVGMVDPAPGFLGFQIIEALFGPIEFRPGEGPSTIEFSFRPEPGP
jgi:anti-sigma regulatory factor (Ser/Thr protein kinase)